jgi:hypothetical protein
MYVPYRASYRRLRGPVCGRGLFATAANSGAPDGREVNWPYVVKRLQGVREGRKQFWSVDAVSRRP